MKDIQMDVQQPNEVRTTSHVNDATTFIELWSILIKHNILMFAVFALTCFVGVTYLLIMQPTFESRAVIVIGRVGQGAQVEAPEVLTIRLKQRHGINDNDTTEFFPKLSAVTIDKKGSGNILTLVTQDRSAEGARKHLDYILQILLVEHARIYEEAMAVKRQRLEQLVRQIQQIQNHISALSSRIESAGKESSSLAAVAAIEKGRLISELPTLDRERLELQLVLGDIHSYPSKLLRPPSFSSRQVKPNQIMVLVIVLILGTVSALVAALIAEFRLKTRHQLLISRKNSGFNI